MESDWALGIFAIMAILIAIIGGATAIRFFYIDNQYKIFIVEYEKASNTLEEIWMDLKAGVEPKFSPATLIAYQRGIGNYTAKRDNNKKQGLVFDTICMLSVLGLGFIATFGVFQNNLLLLSLFLLIPFSIAFANFIMHIKTINNHNSKVV